jgi:hypothetical protein
MRFDLLPEEICIHLMEVRSRGDVMGAAVLIKLEAIAKNYFGCLAGPSDEQGIIRVPRARLYESALDCKNTFLMDYVHPADGLSGVMSLVPLPYEELEAILKFYYAHRSYYHYPDWYEPLLLSSLTAFKQVPVGVLIRAYADVGPHIGAVSRGVILRRQTQQKAE